MNILQKLVDAQLQLQSTQRNWDEECLFKCNDLLGEVIRELQNAQQNAHQTGLCPECDSEVLPTQYCMMGHWCGKPAPLVA